MALINARVWLNHASMVSLVSTVLRERIVAAGAAGKVCRFILKKLSKINWTESLSSTCPDVCSVENAGGRFEPRTSCCWPRNCDSTVAKGVPSRQLVDLQFGLVDTHSADWEPPTCCLLARRGLRVSGKQGPLRNVPPRRRVERIGTQEASNLASHDIFSGKTSVDRSRILVNVLFIRFSICWIGKEIYKFYKFHKVYKLWIDLKICKFKMLYLERQVLTDQES